MLAVRPDRFTEFCCEGTVGALVVVGAIYFLLRAFRRNRQDGGSRQGGDSRPPDDWPPDDGK